MLAGMLLHVVKAMFPVDLSFYRASHLGRSSERMRDHVFFYLDIQNRNTVYRSLIRALSPFFREKQRLVKCYRIACGILLFYLFTGKYLCFKFCPICIQIIQFFCCFHIFPLLFLFTPFFRSRNPPAHSPAVLQGNRVPAVFPGSCQGSPHCLP